MLPPAAPRRRVLLVSRDDELDSLLVRRRIAAHLGDLSMAGMCPDAGPPDVALVCDDTATAVRLLEKGVVVVQLRSGHPGAEDPRPPEHSAFRAHREFRVHRPGWLPGPWPQDDGRPTGTVAPARSARNRVRSGTLLLMSLWGVPDEQTAAFTGGPLQALVREAVRRTGHCTVVCDTRLATVRRALDGRHDGVVRAVRAAEADVDALHASSEVFLASPTLTALTLAHARRSPLTLLPPLGDAQHDLAGRVARVVPLPSADGPGAWAAHTDDGPWTALDPALDDLRGAQRVARTLRQLSLAPR
ncbi:CGA synthase-related protein [Streptomyces olivoreticuli]|uniref:CGA synthase-related protein n=1 Tax=Streptomyces olivoreticuli TaxID=68246 RepID=UPI001F078BF1|nr:CGA synthase-related protein [Streptomyces olivoreticuli]